MSKKTFDIAFRLGAKMDPSMQKAFGNAQKQLGGMRKSVTNVVKTGAKMAAGVVTAGTAAFVATRKITQGMDHISKTSQKMGVTTDFYQQMDYWANQNGVSQENMEKSMKRLNQRLGQAAEGNKKYSGALKTLGVNMDEVKSGTISTEDAMTQALTSLSKMTNEQEKAALASELFGTKLSQDLMTALQDGSTTVEDAIKATEKFGTIIDEDMINAAVELENTWTDVTAMFGGFAKKSMANMIPFFQKVLEFGIDKMPIVQEKISTAMDIAGDVIAKAFEKAQPVISWITETGVPLFMNVMGKVVEIGGDIWDIAKQFYGFISGNWSTIKPILIGIAIALGSLKLAMIGISIVQTITGFFKLFQVATLASKIAMLGLNGAMLANPMTWVVAGIIALIAVGVLLWKNWDKVKEFFVNAWENIKTAVAPVGEAILGAFQTAYEAVTGLFSGIAEWFGGIWEGVTSTLRGAINTIISVANGAINGLNKISITTPDWLPGNLGGKNFGFNIPNIPMLAQGGIVTRPTLAMVGEGSESEAVLPISKLRSFIGETNAGTTNNRNTSEKMQIIYSPQYAIPSGTSKSEIQEISRKGFEDFKRWMKRYEEDKKRKKF